ncbi:MAG: two-component system chemotaxis response regulator CheB [Paraglaciecola sp.]|jgi:two-component system chemotaxis response regulator CheB
MAYTVLVVDDSTFFRRRVKQMLEQDPSLIVVGEAKNGQEAIDQVRLLKPDVVTMDIEMPVMDGITAVRRIMARTPVPIMMFSCVSIDGAQATLDALHAGALDFLPKKFADIAANREEAVTLLQTRVKALCRGKVGLMPAGKNRTAGLIAPSRAEAASALSQYVYGESQRHSPVQEQTYAPTKSTRKKYRCLAIGTSTGGPVALQEILVDLPEGFPYPIVLVQHMPGTFTRAFAERLNAVCNIIVKEAQDGDMLKNGTAYLAPGGRQMLVEGSINNARLKIVDADRYPDENYKPSVDLTFGSVANTFSGEVLGIILTGMGADGREGCRQLKDKGARIWAQDEESSVVYGMPQAVTKAKIAEENIPLGDIANSIRNEMTS